MHASRNEKRKTMVKTRRDEIKKRTASERDNGITDVRRKLSEQIIGEQNEHHQCEDSRTSDTKDDTEIVKEDDSEEGGTIYQDREPREMDEPGIYMVLSKDFFDRTAIHGVAIDRSNAEKMYGLISDKIADYNEACKNKGKKRDIVEMLHIPIRSTMDFKSDIGYTVGAGYDHERVRCLSNNVRDEDNSTVTLSDVKSKSTFFRPEKISDKMCKFLDRPVRTTMTRHEVSRLLSQYVKKKKLVDPKDKRYIYPDARINSLISEVPPRPESIYGDPRVTVFDLHRRLIAHHSFG